MSYLNPFYTVTSGISLTIREGKPDFKNLTIKKCSMSNKTITNYNDLIINNLQNENNINKSQSHLVNSTLDIQSIPDVFNCSVSSNNEKTLGNKVCSMSLQSGEHKFISDKRIKKNQSSSTVKCLNVKIQYKPIDFDKSLDQNTKINKSHLNIREIQKINERKQQYLSYVEDNRKQTRKIYVLNHGDRKDRADLRKSYNPYYV